MKVKSASGLLIYVKDLEKSSKFYETLGFEARKKEDNHITVYLNWFWIDLMSIEKEQNFLKEANLENKGAGLFTYLSVDDVDAAHEDLVKAGYTPSSEPKDWPWGNREFVIRDPDGYKLVIFKRIK